MATFCPRCGSTKYLKHADGCEVWQIPVEMAASDPDAVPEVPDALSPSPCSCAICRHGGCLGNPHCHCRDGINYGQIFAETAKLTRSRTRRRGRP